MGIFSFFKRNKSEENKSKKQNLILRLIGITARHARDVFLSVRIIALLLRRANHL